MAGDPSMAGVSGGGADPSGAGMSPASGADDPTSDQGGQNVLCTILANDDGSYSLIAGDEDDTSGAGNAGAPIGGDTASTTNPPGASANMGGGSPQGQSFDSPGALLKAVLDLLKAHESSASGQGSDEDNFSAGYSGGAGGAPTSKQPAAAMKY
jgi:hypothetical protein